MTIEPKTVQAPPQVWDLHFHITDQMVGKRDKWKTIAGALMMFAEADIEVQKMYMNKANSLVVDNHLDAYVEKIKEERDLNIIEHLGYAIGDEPAVTREEFEELKRMMATNTASTAPLKKAAREKKPARGSEIQPRSKRKTKTD